MDVSTVHYPTCRIILTGNGCSLSGCLRARVECVDLNHESSPQNMFQNSPRDEFFMITIAFLRKPGPNRTNLDSIYTLASLITGVIIVCLRSYR